MRSCDSSAFLSFRVAAQLFDLDGLDLVADLDAEDHVHPARDLSEVGVLPVQMRCRVEADVELGVVADLDVASAGDTYRAFVEGQIAELGFLLSAIGPEPLVPRGKRLAQRVAALGNEAGDNAVERRAIVV